MPDSTPISPHYKIFDSIDLSPFCREGKNRLCITVWYYGEGNMSYFPGKAALRYELRHIFHKLSSFCFL